jgi:hypothetical protein
MGCSHQRGGVEERLEMKPAMCGTEGRQLVRTKAQIPEVGMSQLVESKGDYLRAQSHLGHIAAQRGTELGGEAQV